MNNDFENVNDPILEMYLFESTTLLEELDGILLQSEKEECLSTDSVNEIFRIMHTVKGSAAMMEYNTITNVAHKLEDLFYFIRESGINGDTFQDLFDLVLKVSDYLKGEVEKIRLGQPGSVENDSLSAEITGFLEKMSEHANEEDVKSIDTLSNDSDQGEIKDDYSPNKKKTAKQNLINVDLNKLDTLMDLVGEIVITESMVSGNVDLQGLDLDNFSRASRQLRKLTDELQDMVMSIRMVPIASTFQKMRRIVRDMGKKLNKDVDLVLVGEATEVDKAIIDGIADPLMHLVRNAMDHAIEDKVDRIKANKDPIGRITLSAENIGGDIIITVSDDGKGLDPEMILNKAKEKNLLMKPEDEYTEREIFNLLTLPGFSTKSSVTEFSGRGVGMDVVRKNVEKIGGTVTIESSAGVGTNIFFKIPLTLAIISSMEISVGESIYAVPISNIRESFKASPDQLFTDPDNNELIMIRGECYQIIRLHKIFHLQDSLTNITDGILLMVDSGDSQACIFADKLIGKNQVVVKPLPIYLNRFAAKKAGLAGCTIMGDGSISLILDISSIIN